MGDFPDGVSKAMMAGPGPIVADLRAEATISTRW